MSHCANEEGHGSVVPMIDVDESLLAGESDHCRRDVRRWLLVVGALSLLACGSAVGRDAGASAVPSTSDRVASSSTATERPAQPPESTSDAVTDGVREWIRAAPGRASASVDLVDADASRATSFDSYERPLRVVAHYGGLTLDAWVPSQQRRSADAYWLVAELVSLARSAAIDDLVRASGWTLWTIAGRTMVCPEPSGACHALPEQLRVVLFFCQADRRCTLFAEGEDGRVVEWRMQVGSGGMTRRRVRSWPAIAEPLEGRWDAGARTERGRSEQMPRVERPALVDDPALREHGGSHPADDPNGLGEMPCRPTVRSFRRGELVVRMVGCEVDPMGLDQRPVAFVVTRAGRSEATPLFLPPPGPPEPTRPYDVSVLAGDDAIGFVAEASDGGSPDGFSSEDLWVFVPPDGSDGARLHRLRLGSWSMVGLGAEDEREGYVVGIDRSRSRLEVTGPGVGRFVSCEQWCGSHARRSDRWRGERRAAQLDLRVTYDPNGGFEMSDQDRESQETLCGSM